MSCRCSSATATPAAPALAHAHSRAQDGGRERRRGRRAAEPIHRRHLVLRQGREGPPPRFALPQRRRPSRPPRLAAAIAAGLGAGETGGGAAPRAFRRRGVAVQARHRRSWGRLQAAALPGFLSGHLWVPLHLREMARVPSWSRPARDFGSAAR